MAWLDTTRQQIDSKLYEARTLISTYVELACSATSDANYEDALYRLRKATEDYLTWEKVWVALGGVGTVQRGVDCGRTSVCGTSGAACADCPARPYHYGPDGDSMPDVFEQDESGY